MDLTTPQANLLKRHRLIAGLAARDCGRAAWSFLHGAGRDVAMDIAYDADAALFGPETDILTPPPGGAAAG